jgi:hypothetical protein
MKDYNIEFNIFLQYYQVISSLTQRNMLIYNLQAKIYLYNTQLIIDQEERVPYKQKEQFGLR